MKKTSIDAIKTALAKHVSVGEMGYKHFAILVPIIASGGIPRVLYEVRAKKLDRQPGEICFPGGLIERGETPLECALRETYEEIGIKHEAVDVVADFGAIFTTGGSQIHCFIGIVGEEAYVNLTPSEDEVDEVFTVSLDELMEMEPEIYTSRIEQIPDPDFPYDKVTGGEKYKWRGGSVPVPIYEIDGRAIWGFTARITRQMLEVLREYEDCR